MTGGRMGGRVGKMPPVTAAATAAKGSIMAGRRGGIVPPPDSVPADSGSS